MRSGAPSASTVGDIPLRLPKLAMAMTEGTLVEWLVSDGDDVVDGQPIYVVETDKVETEVPAGRRGHGAPAGAGRRALSRRGQLGWITGAGGTDVATGGAATAG